MRVQSNKAGLIALILINLAVVATVQAEVLSGGYHEETLMLSYRDNEK